MRQNRKGRDIMKRFSALILACILCVAAWGCPVYATTYGGFPSGMFAFTPEYNRNPVEKVEEASLGETIELDFAKITFESVQLSFSIEGTISASASDGMRLFSLVGTIQNTCGSDLRIGYVSAEMTFNGEYTYTANVSAPDSTTYPASLSPLSKARYVLYAEVPEALVDILSTCEVTFSLSEKFETCPASPAQGDYAFKIMLDREECQKALDAADTPSIFFEECPILPTPENYSSAYQSGRSSSSMNGKVSSITYRYSLNPGGSGDIKDVYATYVGKIKSAGFTVKNETGTGCQVYAAETKLASISVSNGTMTFDIVPGNEKAAAPVSQTNVEETATPDEETFLKIGDTIETDYVSLKLEEIGSDTEIRSGKSEYGIYRYFESDNGDPYFYLYGTITNLGGAPAKLRNIYVQFTFDDKYNYRGTVDGVSEANDDFIDTLSPLSEVGCYIYAAVPQKLIDSFSTCKVKIGFTEDFSYKRLDGNDLPLFEYCDDVFNVMLP